LKGLSKLYSFSGQNDQTKSTAAKTILAVLRKITITKIIVLGKILALNSEKNHKGRQNETLGQK
jgi:predicted ATPase